MSTGARGIRSQCARRSACYPARCRCARRATTRPFAISTGRWKAGLLFGDRPRVLTADDAAPDPHVDASDAEFFGLQILEREGLYASISAEGDSLPPYDDYLRLASTLGDEGRQLHVHTATDSAGMILARPGAWERYLELASKPRP